MKKLTVVLLAVLMTAFLATNVSAQGITGKGVKVGLNLANAAGDSVEDANSKMGFAIGGYFTYSINEKFAIKPEFLYSMKGYKIDESEEGFSLKSTTSLNYLDVPILGVYSVNENIRLFAGPSLGLYLSGETDIEMSIEFLGISIDFDTTMSIESDDVNSPDFGLVLGASYSSGKISADVRYSIGLTNFIKEEDDQEIDAKNRVIQLMVGYSF